MDHPSTHRPCPVCDAAGRPPFVRVADQPVHCNLLWSSRGEARAAPRGDIALAFCDTCGHVYNAEFDAAATAYGGTYENSLHHSAVFQGYADELVADLVERHSIRSRDIVEIGAGQGDFLRMLCDAGGNRGTGFDPSFVGEPDAASPVSVVTAFYGEEYADHPADVVISRHVLEHIEQSGDFVRMLRRVVDGRRPLIFFEVPNALWTLQHGGIWDVIYEHCGYFTPASLAAVFRRASFAVERTATVFGGQFLTVEAHPTSSEEPPPASVAAEIEQISVACDGFADVYAETVGQWTDWVAEQARAGRRTVIWGAGSKGVSFLNTVDPSGTIEHAVDINDRKRGRFVAGSGQRIVAPEELPDVAPANVIVMNPNYRTEIEGQLRAVGLAVDVLTL